jgi:hypothetical protein
MLQRTQALNDDYRGWEEPNLEDEGDFPNGDSSANDNLRLMADGIPGDFQEHLEVIHLNAGDEPAQGQQFPGGRYGPAGKQ